MGWSPVRRFRGGSHAAHTAQARLTKRLRPKFTAKDGTMGISWEYKDVLELVGGLKDL